MKTIIALLGALSMGYTHVADTPGQPASRNDAPPSLTSEHSYQDTTIRRNRNDRNGRNDMNRYPHTDSLNHNLGNTRDTMGSPRDTFYRK